MSLLPKSCTYSKAATIKEIAPQEVVLEVHGDASTYTIPISSFLNKEWKLHKLRPEAIEINHMKFGVLNSKEFMIELTKARILLKMASQKGVGMQHVCVTMKPKSVTTTRDFEKGMLQMTVVSHRISIIDHARAKTTGNCITLGLCKFGSDDMIVQVSDPTVLPKDPAVDDGCVSPFWSVQTTAESDEANVELFMHKPTQRLDSVAQIDKMQLPVMKNTVDVEKGTSLCLYREPIVKDVEPLQKRHRTS